MDELTNAIQLLQSQIVEQENIQETIQENIQETIQQPVLNLPNEYENTQPVLNLPNIVDIPNIIPYELAIREQIRSLLEQQNVPEDQIEGMIQQQLNNLSNQGDDGMM